MKNESSSLMVLMANASGELSFYSYNALYKCRAFMCTKIRPSDMPLWRVNRTTFFTADNPGSIAVV